MNIISRFIKTRKAKRRAKDYRKGVIDTNKIRDFEEENKKKIFQYEMGKKDKEIERLKKIIVDNHQKNCDMQKTLFDLREQLTKIEGFVEMKQIRFNVDAIRKLSVLTQANAKVRKIEKSLPDLERESSKDEIETK